MIKWDWTYTSLVVYLKKGYGGISVFSSSNTEVLVYLMYCISFAVVTKHSVIATPETGNMIITWVAILPMAITVMLCFISLLLYIAISCMQAPVGRTLPQFCNQWVSLRERLFCRTHTHPLVLFSWSIPDILLTSSHPNNSNCLSSSTSLWALPLRTCLLAFEVTYPGTVA